MDVLIRAENDGTLDLTVNGVAVVTDLLAVFSETSGVFAFGARTGGLVDNHVIDDLTITTTTETSATPTLVYISPRTSGTHPLSGINAATANGRDTQVDPASVELKLNGQVVPAMILYSNTSVNVWYDPPGALESAADYTVSLQFSDTGSPAVTKTFSWTFQVAPYRGPNGHLYEFVPTPWGVTWEQANVEAQNRSFLGRRGHLVTITSAEEDAFVELVRRDGAATHNIAEVWSGGFQQAGMASPGEGWLWVNGEGTIPGSSAEPGYSNWLINEPNDFQGPDSENYLSLGLFGQFGWNDAGFFDTGILFGYMVEYDSIVVAMDVKPEDASNTIQLKSNGKIPVVVFGSSEVDVSLTDVASIRAGRTGGEAKVVSSSISDVNGDGRADLTVTFNLQEMELACGDMRLHLRGQLAGGTTIRGSDSLNLLGCPPYALAMTALQDVQLRTEVKLGVSALLPGFRPPTNGTQLQLKSYNLTGNLSWTRNVPGVPLMWNSPTSSVGSVWLDDALHLQPLRGNLQVQNSNNGSTEKLYAEARVLNRPDLAVATVNAPEQVNVRQLFNVVAEIRELKLDLGGSGLAYLIENGAVLDVAPFAVEAGRTAGVVFAVRLRSEGAHQLTVRLVNNEVDYDSANNEQTITVEALPVGLEPVSSYIVYSHFNSEYSVTEENAYYIRRYFSAYRTEYFSQSLYIPARLSFPFLASVQVTADGTEQFMAETEVPLAYSDIWDCFRSDNGYVFFEDGTMLQAQSNTDCWGFEQSYFLVSRSSYDQVYYSSEFIKETGELYEYGYEFSSGPWMAEQNVGTRVIIQGESGAFGGSSSADVLNVYDYFSPINHEYDGTIVTGYEKGRLDRAEFGGMTEP